MAGDWNVLDFTVVVVFLFFSLWSCEQSLIRQHIHKRKTIYWNGIELIRHQGNMYASVPPSLFLCRSHLVVLWYFLYFYGSFSRRFLFLSLAYTNKRFSSIELFWVWLLLSFRCSLTAFFVFFSLSLILFVFLSFYQPTNRKLVDKSDDCSRDSIEE